MYPNHYADVIDIIINRGNSIFDLIGKELAKTDPKLFKLLVLSHDLDNKEAYYSNMLWKLGRIKTIKQYRTDNNIGLKESRIIIDRLSAIIGFNEDEWLKKNKNNINP
jgi:hypothetical protein